MSEWFKEPVLKTGDVERHRGFESLSLRQTASMAGLIPYQYHIRRSTQVAVRGSPAKGVGWGDWREGSNPSFSATKCPVIRDFLLCKYPFYPKFYPKQIFGMRF